MPRTGDGLAPDRKESPVRCYRGSVPTLVERYKKPADNPVPIPVLFSFNALDRLVT